MTWLRRVRPVLYPLGVLLVVGSLLGARLLTHGSGGGSEAPPKSAIPPTNGKTGSGPVVIGYVDSDPPPIPYGLPPVLQSGRIAKMSVVQGQDVRKGDTLYEFDTTVQKASLEAAKTAVESAKVAVELAKSQLEQYPKQLEIKRQIFETAKNKADLNEEGYKVYEGNLRDTLNREWKDNPKKWEEQYNLDSRRFELDTLRKTAARERDTAKANLDAAEAARRDLELQVKKAEEGVKQALAAVDQAQAVIDQCTIRADVDGTIERVTVSQGTTLGLGMHSQPAVILVPAGPRVVRAEVEAEFAHRVGPDKEGKDVTIADHWDSKLTYKGVVRRGGIGKAFIQKRNSGDGFGMNDTRVLEVVVDVADPSPAGKPPLRVGQKVRVNFGQ
jgi:multidrug resistance efflux pump